MKYIKKTRECWLLSTQNHVCEIRVRNNICQNKTHNLQVPKCFWVRSLFSNGLLLENRSSLPSILQTAPTPQTIHHETRQQHIPPSQPIRTRPKPNHNLHNKTTFLPFRPRPSPSRSRAQHQGSRNRLERNHKMGLGSSLLQLGLSTARLPKRYVRLQRHGFYPITCSTKCLTESFG